MFPDSDIASSFQCGETKSSYLTVFGIAPFCNSLLMDRIRSLKDGCVLLSDECLNRKTQTKQMDIHLRFWDNNAVVTCYFTSEFMGHATAEDMVEVFHKSIEGLNYKGLAQLSMDGPNVNFKFQDLIQTELERDVNTVYLNVGSSGLHILHGTFKKDLKKCVNECWIYSCEEDNNPELVYTTRVEKHIGSVASCK